MSTVRAAATTMRHDAEAEGEEGRPEEGQGCSTSRSRKEARQGPGVEKATAKPKPAKPLKDEPGRKAPQRRRKAAAQRRPAAKKAPAKKPAKKG